MVLSRFLQFYLPCGWLSQHLLSALPSTGRGRRPLAPTRMQEALHHTPMACLRSLLMLLIGDWPGSSQLVWLRDAAVGIQFAPDEDGDNTAEAHARSVSAIGAGDHDQERLVRVGP